MKNQRQASYIVTDWGRAAEVAQFATRRDWLEFKVEKTRRKARASGSHIHMVTFEHFVVDLFRLNAGVQS